jgi:histidine triad (HIT) family protein
MDAGQVTPGHVLVATRRQVETFVELEEAEAAHLFAVAHRVARAVQAAFAPEGMTLLQTNRPAGWQTVPHVHVHVLPRHTGDGADLVWPRKDPPLAALQALAARLRLDASPPAAG